MAELLELAARLLFGLVWSLPNLFVWIWDARKTFRRRDYSVDPEVYRRHDERAALERWRRGHEPHP